MLVKKPRNILHRYIREAFYSVWNPIQHIYWRVCKPVRSGSKLLCIQKQTNKILLVRIGYGAKTWSLPGGKIDRGETYAETAVREVYEESGVRVAVDDIKKIGEKFYTGEGKKDTVHYFVGWTDQEDLVIDDQEIIDAGWFRADTLPEPCSARVEEALSMYTEYQKEHATY